MPNITSKHYDTRNREMADIMQRYGDEDGKSAAKFRKRTYALHGLLAGTATGIGAGAALGGKGNRLAGAALGGFGGMALGGNAGAIIERNPKRKNFSTMTSTTRTLVQFSAHLDNKLAQSGLVEFARDPRQPEESTLGKVGKVAAVGAGAAGLAAGGLYLRGRHALGADSGVGIKDTIKYGGNLLAYNDAPMIGRGIDAVSAKAAQGAKFAKTQMKAGKEAVMQAGRTVGKRAGAVGAALRGK